MPFQLTRAGVRHPSLDEVTALRDEYAARHCVTLRDFLEPQLLSWLQRRVARGRWIETVHQALDPPSVDLMLVDDVASGAFVAMTNTPEVFDLVRSITGCAPIGCYAFRVYRMEKGKGPGYLAWRRRREPARDAECQHRGRALSGRWTRTARTGDAAARPPGAQHRSGRRHPVPYRARPRALRRGCHRRRAQDRACRMVSERAPW